jgi:hypothetical protein
MKSDRRKSRKATDGNHEEQQMEIMNKNLETASHLTEPGAFLSSNQIRNVNGINHQIFKAYTPLISTYSIHNKQYNLFHY